MRHLVPLLLLSGCAPEAPRWYEQLEPDGPCYRVDLADGLDESRTDEVQDLFGCLNAHDHFASMVPVSHTLEGPTPAGDLGAIALARAVNALPGADVDLLALAGGIVAALDADPQAATHAQDIGLELIYGRNHSTVRRQGFDLRDPEALGSGALVPLAPVVPTLSRALLDDDLEALTLAGDIVEDPETHRWIHTVSAWSASEHPVVQGPVDALVPALGEAIVDARSPSNDRWRGASGDSLRDLVEVAMDADLVEAISPELNRVLGDARVRRQLPDLLVALQAQGHLQVTPAQATWMAEINVDGDLLDAREDSALTALVRLLHDTNRPMRCTLDIWITTLDVDFGNLAVALLRVFADQDPDDVQSTASLFGDLLGYGISDGVLRTIADSGTCPALTQQVVTDLGALDRLGDPQARGLTHTLIGLLRVLKQGDGDRVEELVQIVADAWDGGAVPPLEEVLRDIGEGELGANLVDLVAVMDRPERFGITTPVGDAADLEDLLALTRWLVDPASDGRTGWSRLRPLVESALAEDGTWSALGVAGERMADGGGALSHAQDLLPPITHADPELRVLTQLGPVLRSRDVMAPLLDLGGTSAVFDELLRASPTPDEPEVPLAFAGRLVVGGSLDDLLRMVRIVLRDLDAIRAEAHD